MNNLPTGTRIAVSLFGGQRIEATVDYFEDDIKNGRPGYSLKDCSDGVNHWCYADQVEAILIEA